MNRRNFLALAATVPVVGAAGVRHVVVPAMGPVAGVASGTAFVSVSTAVPDLVAVSEVTYATYARATIARADFKFIPLTLGWSDAK